MNYELSPGFATGLYYSLGALYILVFIILAAKKPKIALCLTFGLVPIQRALKDLPGDAKVTLADLNLTMTFGVFCFQQLIRGKRIRWGPLAFPALLYLGICALASADEWHDKNAVVAFLQMVPYLVFSVIVFADYGTMEDMRSGFYLLLGVGLFFAISTIVAFSPNIYGMTKNGLGASLACVTIVAGELWFSATDLKLKRIFLATLVITVAALLITLSRGAWLAAIAGLLLLLALRGEFKLLLKSVLVIVPVVVLFWTILPPEDKAWAVNFDVKSDNIGRRIDFINTAWTRFEHQPLLGGGIGWRKNMDATNLVLMSLAESGILGLAAFAFIHVVAGRMVWRACNGLNRTSWSFSCMSIGAALLLAHLVHGMVDHYWSRGSISLAWAGAGLLTRGFYESQIPFARTALPAIVRITTGRPRPRPRRPSQTGTPWRGQGPAADGPPQA